MFIIPWNKLILENYLSCEKCYAASTRQGSVTTVGVPDNHGISSQSGWQYDIGMGATRGLY
jgi:hypothetical protein